MREHYPQVQMHEVRSGQEKLNRLVELIQERFLQGQRIQVSAPSALALHFLDILLWKHQPSSFLPHVQTEGASEERIVLSTSNFNLNQADVCFYLQPDFHDWALEFGEIVDLYDRSEPEKEAKSRERLAKYRELLPEGKLHLQRAPAPAAN